MRVTERFEPIVLSLAAGTTNAMSVPRQQIAYRLVALHVSFGSLAAVAAPVTLVLRHEIQLGAGSALTLGTYGLRWTTAGNDFEGLFAPGLNDNVGSDSNFYPTVALPPDLIVEPSQSLRLAMERTVGAEYITSARMIVKWLERLQDR